tara:strand:- start:582 stop:860 length:279 start_codon:yes stop_codon:yes gene_type:complete
MVVVDDAAHHHHPNSKHNEHHWFLYCVLVFVSNKVMISSFLRKFATKYPTILQGWCRGQDLNLRTNMDWDLIPAPLTKLGNPCLTFAVMLCS